MIRVVSLKLKPQDWRWIDRELLRRHVTLAKYLAQVLEAEIAIETERRGEIRSRRSGLPTPEERADAPRLAHER